MERLIEGSTTLHASASRAMRVLRDHAEVVLGGQASASRRHRALGVGPFHRGIALELGGPRDDGNCLSRPIRWEADVHRELFPVFDGEITVERDEEAAAVLFVRGLYIVPFGAFGRFGDGAAGRRIARRCIAGLVGDVARRIDEFAEPLEPHEDARSYDAHVVDWDVTDAPTSLLRLREVS